MHSKANKIHSRMKKTYRPAYWKQTFPSFYLLLSACSLMYTFTGQSYETPYRPTYTVKTNKKQLAHYVCDDSGFTVWFSSSSPEVL